jgi:hypothetical protein
MRYQARIFALNATAQQGAAKLARKQPNGGSMPSNQDEIQIEILADGTIRCEVDSISNANHLVADKFLAWIAEQAGGQKSRQRRGTHTHTHHEHDKVKA